MCLGLTSENLIGKKTLNEKLSHTSCSAARLPPICDTNALSMIFELETNIYFAPASAEIFHYLSAHGHTIWFLLFTGALPFMHHVTSKESASQLYEMPESAHQRGSPHSIIIDQSCENCSRSD